MSSSSKPLPPIATVLQQDGYTPLQPMDETINQSIKFLLLNQGTILPSKATDTSAGYNISA